MTITFSINNDVIVYPLEKMISYARDNQDIFFAQSIWWISSIIGLQQRFIVHVDNLKVRSEIPSRSIEGLSVGGETTPQATNALSQNRNSQSIARVSATPQDIQEESRSKIGSPHIDPDRISQVHDPIYDISDLDLKNRVISILKNI